MKSILEQALVHLLNEDTEKAHELMHQFVVERARSINESLREGDEMEFGADLEEEFFTEADLEDAEAADQLGDDLDDTDMGGDMGGDDMSADMGDADMGGDDMSADMGDAGEEDMGADMDTDGGDVESKIDAIADEMAELQAEFDKVMAEFDEISGDDDSDDMDTMSGEEPVADDVDAMADTGETSEDDEFDDITESMVDELKKVTTPNTDGMGATGGKLSTPTVSPIAKDAKAGPIKTKVTPHVGFERETPPKSGALRKSTNNLNRAKDTLSNVPASGPKAATLAQPLPGNTKSPVATGKKK